MTSKVIELLQETSSEGRSLLAELETVYYGEVEQLRLRGEQLALDQRATFEATLDSLNHWATFALTVVQELEKR